MSPAFSMLSKYWQTPWLRRRGLEMLRAEHIAEWGFNVLDIVIREHCGLDGGVRHYGVVERMTRDSSRSYAHVRLVCQKGAGRDVGTMLLIRALPPFPKEVLDLRNVVRKELESR